MDDESDVDSRDGMSSGAEGSPMSRLRRLRVGELGALAGAICVIVSLTLPWYEASSHAGAPGGQLDAWSTFDAAVVFLIIGCLAAIALTLANLFERSTALPVTAAVWATLFGFGAVIAAIVRLLFEPAGSSTLFAPWLALIGSVAMMLGGWESMRDERPEIYEPTRPERRSVS